MLEAVSRKIIIPDVGLFIPKKFTIEKAPYTVLKITPYKKGYKDKDFIKIINTISKYSNPFLDRFELRKDSKEVVYKPNQPFSYEILFTKDKISFYYAVPNIYKSVFMNKVKFLLDKCDIVEEEDYLDKFIDSYKYSIKQKKDWFMAIDTSEGINVTDSMIILSKELQGNDKILFQYMMKPMFEYEWKQKWDIKNNRYNSTGIVHGGFNILGTLDKILDLSLKHIDLMLNAIMMAFCGEEVTENIEERQSFSNELNLSTKQKTIYDGFNTNANLFIKSDDFIVRDSIARNTSTIMLDLEEDNGFIVSKGKIAKEKEVKREVKRGFVANTLESKQMIKLPSEKFIEEYEEILDIIKVEELGMPNGLFNDSGIPLGEMKKGSIYQPIGFGKHSNSLSKPFIYLGEQESGKSSFMRGYGISALEEGHSIFAFDTIDGKTVEIIRDHLSKKFPEEKIIILDFRNKEYIFPLLWNEISSSYIKQLKKTDDVLEKYQILEEFGGEISSELIRFVDIFEEDRSRKLSPLMKKILSEVTQLVFMNQGTFGMVRDCLYDVDLRHRLLKQLDIPLHLPFCKSILRLDEESDNSPTIKGIVSRLNLIMENDTLKKYFSISNEENTMDFAKWANEGYCVLFNIPEESADILVTFLVQKLWLAITSSRYDMEEDDRPHTHLLIDEPNKFPTIMSLLRDHIIASRKWHLRFLFFIHNMNIFRGMGENLTSAGTSFVMLPTSTFNFNQIAEFFKPYDYSALKEVERLIAKSEGKFRYGLCSIHYKSANYPCIIKLPLPPEMRYKKIDRSHLNNKCAKKYGIRQREYYEELFRQETEEDLFYEIDKEDVVFSPDRP